jgi:DNA-binding SARP family transcriptional activator
VNRRAGRAKSAGRSVAIVRGAAAVVTLAAATIGLPLMLYKLGGSPTPTRWPSFRVMIFVLLHKDNGSLFLGAIRDVAWIAWAAFTLAVLAETQAALRGRPAPRLHLAGLQRAAGRLVTVASIGFSSPVAITLAAAPFDAPAALAAQVQPAVAQNEGQALTLDALAKPVVDAMQEGRGTFASHQVVAVRPGDCLWTIAQHYLGSGERYPTLVRLNLGRDMGDGRVFTDPSLIMPGWRLRLPEGWHAGDHEPPPQQHSGHPSGSKHFASRHGGAGGGGSGGAGLGRAGAERGSGGAGSGSAPAAGLVTAGGHRGTGSTARAAGDLSRPQASGMAASAGRHDEVAQVALFTLGMIAGAALVALERLRHRQRQNRRPGRRIALPADADGKRVEQKLRAATPPAPPTSLRDALCGLSEAMAAAGQPLPPIVGVHLTAASVEVLLSAPPAEPPPPPFSIAPGRQGMRWMASLADAPPGWAIPPPAPGAVGDLLPGLFTAGVTEAGGYLLLDLEAMRVTCCDGPGDLADRLLVTAATELAASRWSGWYELVLAGCDELDVLGRAERCRDLDEALDVLEAKVRTVERRLRSDQRADVRTRRMEDPEDEDWGLTLLVSRVAPTPQQMSRLLSLGDGPGGIAALVAGDTESDDGRLAPAVVRLEPDADDGIIATISLACLGPGHRLTVRPQTLTVSEYKALAGLFETAAQTPDVSPESAPYGDYGGPPWMRFAAAPVPADVAEDLARPVSPGETRIGTDPLEPDEPGDAPGARRPSPGRSDRHARSRLSVNVLGPVEVAGSAQELQPKQAELVLALALHSPVGLSNSALCTLLGADADHPRPPDSVRQLITRTRRRLGQAAGGQENIIHLGSGIYVLHEDVRLDWATFSSLARRGRAERDTADLGAALHLVRGQPFADCYHWWIDIALVETMRAEIVDTADLLAGIELSAGRPEAAGQAARLGLSAETAAEQLWRALMRAEHAAGNSDGVAEAWTACLDAINEIAPGGEPHPDTARLYRELISGPGLGLR